MDARASPISFDELKRGHYGAILADPATKFKVYSDRGKGRSPDRHYETMSRQQLYEMPVATLGAPDSLLWLWVTGPDLAAGNHLSLMQHWGYAPSSIAFVWPKINPGVPLASTDDIREEHFFMGMGYTTRQNAEFVVLGRRGDPKRKSKSVRQILIGPRREHSRKPDAIHDKIEAYCCGPYCELFARMPRFGWDTWGNEIGKFS